LIGDGVLLDETKELVNSLKIENSVHFLGLKNNVNDYMCAADCFVMPSIHEGLPIVSVESQASDLPCVLSTNVSDECKLTDSVKFVSLSSPLKDWVKIILKTKTHQRKSNTELFKKIGFDESSAIKTIEKLYSNQGENHD
jgi:glycosyltransferase involved in cell wall biosynthesis